MKTPEKWVPWVPQIGDVRPRVYQWRYKGRDDAEWSDGSLMGKKIDAESCRIGDYRIPAPSAPAPLNDTCLVWLAGTIATASKQFPGAADALRAKWLKVKAEAAAEMIASIERVRNGGAA